MVANQDGPSTNIYASDRAKDLENNVETAERDGAYIPETDSTGYRIREEPYGTKRKIRVVLMGAGASTANFLKKAEEEMQNVEVRAYEKNHGVGGTWLEVRDSGVFTPWLSLC
jgi:hypothetical protein